MTQPLISIITISWNCADAVEKTMRSVLSQRFTDFEYIVIDGGSTDGTADIIRRHSNSLSYWVPKRTGVSPMPSIKGSRRPKANTSAC